MDMTQPPLQGDGVSIRYDADGTNGHLSCKYTNNSSDGISVPKAADKVSIGNDMPGNHEHNCVKDNSTNFEDGSYVPRLGMEFDDEHSAFEFYNFYAQKLGFSVRVNSWNMNTRGVLTRKTFTCYKEGYPRPRPNGGVIKTRPNARCGCPARLVVKRGSNSKLYVAEFEPMHNHQLASPTEVHLLRSHRNVTKAHAAIVDLADSLGLTPKPIYKFIERQFGGKRDSEKSIIATRFSLIANTLIKIAITASEDDETYKYLESQSTIIKDVVECMLNRNTSVVHPYAHAQNLTPAMVDDSSTCLSVAPSGDAHNSRVEMNENEGSRTDKMNNTRKKESRDQRRSRTKRMLEEKRKKRKLETNEDPVSTQGPTSSTSQERAMHLMPWGVQYMQQATTAPTENLRRSEANRSLGKHVYGVYVPVIVPYVFPQSSQDAPTFTKLMEQVHQQANK